MSLQIYDQNKISSGTMRSKSRLAFGKSNMLETVEHFSTK